MLIENFYKMDKIKFKDLEGNEHELSESKEKIVRIGCYGIIKNNDDKYLMIVTNKNKGWEFPGGGCNFLESLQECVVREVKEETGYGVELIQEQPMHTIQHFVYSRKRNQFWKKIDFLFVCELKSTIQHDLALEDEEEILEQKWMSIEEMKSEKWIYFIEEHKEEIMKLIKNSY